jgi:hypothetical protein
MTTNIPTTSPIIMTYNRLTVYGLAVVCCFLAVTNYYLFMVMTSSIRANNSVMDLVWLASALAIFTGITCYAFYICIDVLMTRYEVDAYSITEKTLLTSQTLVFSEMTKCRLTSTAYYEVITISQSKARLSLNSRMLEGFSAFKTSMLESGRLANAG